MAAEVETADAWLRSVVRRADVVARYWDKVLKGSGDQCWIWTGAISGKGHGRFRATPERMVIAHRFGWALAHPGETLPEVVEHECDNPVCQNPGVGHLLASTNANNREAWAARRRTPGNPARDLRGARGRAHAIRDAARSGASIEAAMRAGLGPLDLDQGTLW